MAFTLIEAATVKAEILYSIAKIPWHTLDATFVPKYPYKSC